MQKVACIITEMQMITGVTTNDLDYLMYVLLDGGTYFSSSDSASSKFVQGEVKIMLSQDINMDEWLSNLEEF